MPYKSKRQLRTCFSRQLVAEATGKKWTWDCKEFLEKTESARCLPEQVGGTHKCRPMRNGEKIISPVYKGPKGGYFFFAGGVKVYVPKAATTYAKKKYGSA